MNSLRPARSTGIRGIAARCLLSLAAVAMCGCTAQGAAYPVPAAAPPSDAEASVPQEPGRRQPPVAEQKEWEPGPSLIRASMGVPYLQEQPLAEALKHLSSPLFEGRLTGTEGYDRAARYAAEQFRTWGVTPGGENGTYFQPFTLEANEVTSDPELRMIHGDWVGPAYRFGVDYVARGFTGSGRIENAPVVFVGYGLEDAERGWNDYQGIATEGSVALMFMGVPPGTGDWGEMSRPRYKATLARARDVRAILLIDDPGDASPCPIGSVYHGDVGSHQPDIPQLSIRNRVADDLLAGTPHTAESLRLQISDSGRPYPLRLRTQVSLKAEAQYESTAQTWNVVGFIEGSDPSVADEYVIVGAHLDHVGQQGNVLFAGAKDNASGSVMVLGLSKAMSRSPVKPRRSVYFVLFAGEELFLAGSEYFAAHLPGPVEKAAGMINLDIVGVGPDLRMEGGATTPLFQQMAVEADRLYGNLGIEDRDPTPAREGASDHSAFVRAGIPTLYFHSGGATGRIHTPADVAGTIDFEAFVRTARVVYATLFQIADRPSRQSELPFRGSSGPGCSGGRALPPQGERSCLQRDPAPLPPAAP